MNASNVQAAVPPSRAEPGASGSLDSSALSYYLHTHSGTFWLVLLAFMKSVVWPAFVVYHVLTLR